MKKITLFVLFFIISYSYSQSSQSVLFMDKENGVFTLPCKVNGIPMKFIFDTGASNVSISLTEAQFLVKQGLLADKEIFGSVKYQIANGEVKEGTRIIIRQIEIGDHVLNNVEAFITHELNSPLLLGQSAISKLGKIEIEGNKLVITPLNPRNRFEFLNIDLSKHINDFGYSAAALQQPLTPYALEILRKDNNHFLSRYEFDKEVVLFSESGYIPIILLQKEFESEKYYGDNEEKAKIFFEEITQAITKQYGSYSTKNARVIEWNSPDYQMMLNLSNENSVTLAYNNLNIKFFEKSELQDSTERIPPNNESDIENSLVTSIFNDFLQVFQQTNTKSFSFLKGKVLEIHFEKELEILPSDEDLQVGSRLKKMEQELIRNYSEHVIINMFQTKEDIELLKDFHVNKFRFIMKLQYSDNTINTVVKHFLVKDLRENRLPLSKNEFSRLLY